MTVSALIAAVAPSPSATPTEIDPSRVTPGALGFLAIVFMAVAIFFLWKSMSKQLKRIDFDEAATDRKKPRPAAATEPQPAPAADEQPAPDVAATDAGVPDAAATDGEPTDR